MTVTPLNIGRVDVGPITSNLLTEQSPRDSITLTPRRGTTSDAKQTGIFTNPRVSLQDATGAAQNSIRKQSPPGVGSYNRFLSQTAEGVPRFAL